MTASQRDGDSFSPDAQSIGTLDWGQCERPNWALATTSVGHHQPVPPKNLIRADSWAEIESGIIRGNARDPRLIVTFVIDLFKSQRRLEAENLFLRHQLNIAVRRAPRRFQLRRSDRILLVWMIRLMPSLLDLSQIVRSETILRWHRSRFRAYWGWKSRGQIGRPTIEREVRDLIRRVSEQNPLWGAPRIHGELLKLGLEVAQSTVSKYMIKRRGPPSQGWRTFLRNHADAIAAIDLCVVPTLTSSGRSR